MRLKRRGTHEGAVSLTSHQINLNGWGVEYSQPDLPRGYGADIIEIPCIEIPVDLPERIFELALANILEK